MTLAALAAIASLLGAPASAAAPSPVVSTSAPAEAPLYARCHDGVLDADLLVANRVALLTASGAQLDELSGYLACRALAGASPSCEALDGVGGALGEGASSCRDLEREARLVQAALSGGDASGSCRRQFAGRGSPDAVAKACASAVAAAAAGRPQDACADLRAAGLSSDKDDRGCARKLGYWRGRPAECASLGDKTAVSRCRALASLAAGLRSKDACAASPLCRALSGGGAPACAPLSKSLSDRVCGEAEKSAKAEREEARRRELAEKQEKARKEQFHKGEPMNDHMRALMKKTQKGEPPPSAPQPDDPPPGDADGTNQSR